VVVVCGWHFTPWELGLVIRISEKDLRDLQKRAMRQGIPCQTMISSVLHKYVSGRFTEK
jgi:predicted DNA binding CopG/RHH family protein